MATSLKSLSRMADMSVQDDTGRTRAYLTACTNSSWYHVYLANGKYLGAGTTLQAAIDMATEKTGIDHEALPAVLKKDLRIEKGEAIKINGYQGGGFYRHDTIYLGNRRLGILYLKNQPARSRYERMTMADGHDGCVIGHNLNWMLRQHGYRLVED